MVNNPLRLLVPIQNIIRSGYSIRPPQPVPTNNTIEFESRFECGNLAVAVKQSGNEYDLALQNDINTKGHTQWFYFKCTAKVSGPVKFNLVNHTKSDSLFNYGMRILASSDQLLAGQWHRTGTNISYYQNNFKKETLGKSRFFYTLTFTYDFQPNENVFFAYCFPYSYTNLKSDLGALMKDPQRSQFVKRVVLCKTLAGNRQEMLTITAPGTADEIKQRKGVVISGRIHPGESNCSFIMKGVIDFLTKDDSPDAYLLRQHFVFQIVPMINVDGVICGNYRSSLAGVDLNRQWQNPNQILFPEIFHLKKMILNFNKTNPIVLYCDLHGHSRARSIFMYGNNYSENPESTRLFPYIMQKLVPQMFNYKKCTFNISKVKEGTGRVCLWKLLKIPAVYTLEASLCGGAKTSIQPHFVPQSLFDCGRFLCLSILVYQNLIVDETFMQQLKLIQPNILPQELSLIREAVTKELLSDASLLQVGEIEGEEEQNSDMSIRSQSDSEPSEDNLEEDELAKIVPQLQLKEFLSNRTSRQTDSQSQVLSDFQQIISERILRNSQVERSFIIRKPKVSDKNTHRFMLQVDSDQQSNQAQFGYFKNGKGPQQNMADLKPFTVTPLIATKKDTTSNVLKETPQQKQKKVIKYSHKSTQTNQIQRGSTLVIEEDNNIDVLARSLLQAHQKVRQTKQKVCVSRDQDSFECELHSETWKRSIGTQVDLKGEITLPEGLFDKNVQYTQLKAANVTSPKHYTRNYAMSHSHNYNSSNSKRPTNLRLGEDPNCDLQIDSRMLSTVNQTQQQNTHTHQSLINRDREVIINVQYSDDIRERTNSFSTVIKGLRLPNSNIDGDFKLRETQQMYQPRIVFTSATPIMNSFKIPFYQQISQTQQSNQEPKQKPKKQFALMNGPPQSQKPK